MAKIRMTRKKLLIVFIIFTILVPAGYVIFYRHYVMVRGNQSVTQQYQEMVDDNQTPGMRNNMLRVVHLDLKGAPPRPEYFTRFLTLLAQHGCNALLLEYEDMYPYTGRLANISASNAYTQQQVRKFLSLARDHSIEVIPLVQTFGHLEFALKLPEFKDLRELEPFPQEICPSNPKSIALIEEMIDQIMRLHPLTKYLHIGCDEVFHLAACGRCNNRQISANDIFSEHVMTVAQLIRSKYPTVTPIIWDDMIRKWPIESLMKSNLAQYIEPMVWAYTNDISRLVQHYTWHWYNQIFKRIWVAGAFKGATTPTSLLPNLQEHYENHKSWMKFIENSKAPIGGIVFTGWSRYDHFSVLCELLPVSIPSLLLSLNSVKLYGKADELIYDRWSASILCPSQINPQSIAYDPKILSYCRFEGSDLYSTILHYEYIRTNIETFYKTFSETRGWFTSYNIRHNFTSPFRLIEDHSLYTCHQFLERLERFKNDTREVMNQYYDKFTIEEWLEQKVGPLEQKLNDLLKLIDSLMKTKVWPRRPIR